MWQSFGGGREASNYLFTERHSFLTHKRFLTFVTPQRNLCIAIADWDLVLIHSEPLMCPFHANGKRNNRSKFTLLTRELVYCNVDKLRLGYIRRTSDYDSNISDHMAEDHWRGSSRSIQGGDPSEA